MNALTRKRFQDRIQEVYLFKLNFSNLNEVKYIDNKSYRTIKINPKILNIKEEK